MGTDGEVARLHGLYWLTADVARKPTVVIVDDAQWCDLESLRFLGYLQRRLDDLPVLLVLGVRTGEGDLVDALATVVHDPEVPVLRLAPLSAAGVADLLASLLGGAPSAPAVAAATEVSSGNPLLVTVLARSLAREGVDPATVSAELVARLGGEAVQRQLRSQLDRLGAPAPIPGRGRRGPRRRSRAGGGLGLAGLSPLTSAEAAGELATWGFADVEGGPSGRLRFRHAIVADAVLSLRAGGAPPDSCADTAPTCWNNTAAHPRASPPSSWPSHPVSIRRRRVGSPPPPTRRYAAAPRPPPWRSSSGALAEELAPEERHALLLRAGKMALHTDLDTAARLLEEATAGPLAAEDPEPWADLGAAYGYLRDPDRAIDAVQHALRLVPAGDEERRDELEASLLVAAVVTPGRDDLTDRLPALKGRLGDSSGARQPKR